MAASLFGVGLWLAGAAAPAQEPAPELRAPPPAVPSSERPSIKTLHFTKQPEGSTQSPPASPPALKVPEKVIHLGKSPTTAPAQQETVIHLGKSPTTAPPEQDAGLLSAVLQQPKSGAAQPDVRAPGEDSQQQYQVQLEPPGPQRLFRLESEDALHARMEQEARERPRPERLEFPDYRPLTTERHTPRVFAPSHMVVEPNYVCYGRLAFEEINSERYGWEVSFLQPFISAGWFYWDVLALPYHAFTEPCRHFDCNAGYCLPGDPVPYLLYPPGLSLTGGVAQAGAVIGLIAIFP